MEKKTFRELFIVYYAEPYKLHELGYLVRHRLFYDWKKASNFKKKQDFYGFHASLVALSLTEDGIFKTKQNSK